MRISLEQLDHIQIASPCTASWEAMKGDDRVRFCGECSKHVYRFDGMSRAAIVKLLREAEGEVCGRLSRRRDGTIITDDCPVGVQRARRRRRVAMLLACLPLTALGAMASYAFRPAPTKTSTSDVPKVVTEMQELWNDALVATGLRKTPPTVQLMGCVALPVTPAPPPIPPLLPPEFNK